MVSNTITAFLCICCWFHGATTGIALGDDHDQLEIYHFLYFSFILICVIVALWMRSPPLRRLAASLTFLAWGSFLILIVKSIAWFRTPKLDQWTALPDIGHDLLNNTILSQPSVKILSLSISLTNLPSYLGLCLVIATTIFIGAHPLRLTITRRLLMIYATILFSRAITAVLTYLPDSNPSCHQLNAGLGEINSKQVVRQMMLTLVPALVSEPKEWGGIGCRDSVFSGHTVMLILCAMTWHTYYKWVPSSVNKVKALIWSVTILVILLALAQRRNYTLDVVLGTYFSITTWATYHRLANDVVTGHAFSTVWLIDKMMVYPIMEWMEACVSMEGLNRFEDDGSPRHRVKSCVGRGSNNTNTDVRLYRRDSNYNTSPTRKKDQARRRPLATFRTSEW